MVNLSLKALIGVGVAGAVGAGGYGVYVASQKEETILDALNKKNLTLLRVEGVEDNTEWEKKIGEYKTKTSEKPNLEGYKAKTDGNNEEQKKANIESMKNICKALIQEFAKDVAKLAQAEKWCVKDKSPS